MTSQNLERLNICLNQLSEKCRELQAIPDQSPDMVPSLVRLNAASMDMLLGQLRAELTRLEILPPYGGS